MLTRLLLFCSSFDLVVRGVFKDVDLRGDVWPKVRESQVDKNVVYRMDLDNLKFVADFDKSTDCEKILNDNIFRYTAIMKQTMMHYGGSHKPDEKLNFENELKTIEISKFDNSCAYPSSKQGCKFIIELDFYMLAKPNFLV